MKKILVLIMVLMMAVPFQAFAYFEPAELPKETGKDFNGMFEIDVKIGEIWTNADNLQYGKFQETKEINLGEFISGENALIRIRQKGGGASYLDAVFLDGAPPLKANGDDNKVLYKLSKEDLDITPVENEVILEFEAADGEGILSLTGRIEPVVIGKEPLQFPETNNYKPKNSIQDFYTYTLDSNIGTIKVDGKLYEIGNEEPFVKEYRIPGSGHPAGDTYFWVMNDGENLYVTIDVTPDNTFDGDKDYAKVYVYTDEGVKEFKISVLETKWGNTGFTYTDKVAYEHKVYEFSIPLVEVNTEDGDDVKLAFVVYGTVALPEEYYSPDLAYDADDDVYVCVYNGIHSNDNYSNSYIWADIIKSDGTVLNEYPLLISSSDNELYMPSIAYDYLNDRFMVVWCQGYSDTKIYGKIFELEKFDDDNYYIDSLEGPFRITNNEDIDGTEWIYYDEFEPDVVFNRNYEDGELNGHYLVVWSQRANDSLAIESLTEDDIYGRFVSSSGELKGTNGFPICTEAGRQVEPSVCYSFGNEVFAVSWLSEHSDMNAVNACIINDDGTLGDRIESIDGDVRNPNISVNELNDYFLLTWVKGNQVNGVYLFYNGSILEPTGDESNKIFNISTEESYKEYPISIYGKSNMLCLWNSMLEGPASVESYANLRFLDQYRPLNDIFKTSEPELTQYDEMSKSLDIASNYLGETYNENFLIAYVNMGGNDISYRVIGEPPVIEPQPYIEFGQETYEVEVGSEIQAIVTFYDYFPALTLSLYEGTDVTEDVIYEFDSEYVTINEFGVITGIKDTGEDTTQIRAYLNPPVYYRTAISMDYSEEDPYISEYALIASAEVIVTKAKEPGLEFVDTPYEVRVENTLQAQVEYFDGTAYIDVTDEILEYRSENPEIATITSGGAITGLAVGKTRISADYLAWINDLPTTFSAITTVSVTKKSEPRPSPEKEIIGQIIVDGKIIKNIYPEDLVSDGGIYSFEAAKTGNNAKLWLLSSYYKQIANKTPKGTLQLVWDAASYNLPLKSQEVLKEVNGMGDSRVNIVIEKIDDKDIMASALTAIDKLGGKLVSGLVDFDISVEGKTKTVSIDSYDLYVDRTIDKLNTLDYDTTSAMKLIEDDEVFTFTPSVFSNGSAAIKYRGNGIFAIVTNPKTFSDISNHWSRMNVEKLAARNIAYGKDEQIFAPNDYITRAEFAVMITRALGITEEEGTINFEDVEGWYAEDISTAYDAGLISGRGDGKFYPNERILRKDMAVMIHNALKFADKEIGTKNIEGILSRFTDSAAIAEYAKESTAVCADAGIIMGRDTKEFDPDENATRAEASAIIERMLEYLEFIN